MKIDLVLNVERFYGRGAQAQPIECSFADLDREEFRNLDEFVKFHITEFEEIMAETYRPIDVLMYASAIQKLKNHEFVLKHSLYNDDPDLLTVYVDC